MSWREKEMNYERQALQLNQTYQEVRRVPVEQESQPATHTCLLMNEEVYT